MAPLLDEPVRPTPIPADEIPEGCRTLILTAPDGDLMNAEIAPIEVLIDQQPEGPAIRCRMVLEDDDIEAIEAGARVFWFTLWGDHFHVFEMAFPVEAARE
jgi:hypothetical protein